MEKYLILKGYAGLGDRLSSLGYAIKLATDTNRILLIDWSDYMWCQSENKGFFYYFKLKNLPENLKIIYGDEEVKNKLIELNNQKNLSIDPKKFQNNLCNHFKPHDLFDFNDNINIMLKRFKQTNTDILVLCFYFLDKKYDIYKYIDFVNTDYKKYDIGIHFRNSDRKSDFNNFKKQIDYLKNKMDISNKTIYLSTDDPSSINKFIEYLGIKVDFNPKFIQNDKGIHNLTKSELNEYQITKEELNNILLDELKILINCKHFIPSPLSCLSHIAFKIRQNLLFSEIV